MGHYIYVAGEKSRPNTIWGGVHNGTGCYSHPAEVADETHPGRCLRFVRACRMKVPEATTAARGPLPRRRPPLTIDVVRIKPEEVKIVPGTEQAQRRSRRTQPRPPHDACCHVGAAPTTSPPCRTEPIRLTGTTSLPKSELPCPPCVASCPELGRLASPEPPHPPATLRLPPPGASSREGERG
jgi:hypothetical protein